MIFLSLAVYVCNDAIVSSSRQWHYQYFQCVIINNFNIDVVQRHVSLFNTAHVVDVLCHKLNACKERKSKLERRYDTGG